MTVSPSSSAQAAREALAVRLTHLRKDAGLTGRELSARCGWHLAKTSRIQKGDAAPSDTDIRTYKADVGGSNAPPDWVLTRRRAIGDRIRAARLTTGLTQEQVALRIGMDRATYNRIEMGHSAALIDSLILIADALGTDLADFVRK